MSERRCSTARNSTFGSGRAPICRLVDYFLGATPDALQHLVESRVIPGEELGRAPGTCVVTNTHWRPEDMDAEEWVMTYYLWKTEVYLIKGHLERSG